MTFEEFSPAAIACAIGWMAYGADRTLGGDYFTRWAVAALVEEKFTFEFLTDFEAEIRRRFEAVGLFNIPPSLAGFVRYNAALAIVSRPGDNARAAGRPLYPDECPECRQDPCACRCAHERLNEEGICRRCGADRRGI